MRILVLTAFLFFSHIAHSAAMSSATDKVTIQTVAGAELPFNVELATKRKELLEGLMFREELAEDGGMLFVFHRTDMQSFWMKNTLIPLDLLFIDEYGIVRHIHHEAKPHDLTSISSQVPVKAVLEINGGQAKAKGIKVGDRVLHKVFLADSDIIVY